jgi:Reverse transcriptase (RNA-dependent DNA polymerase)
MMPSQQKSSSSRRGTDKSSKKKAAFDQAFLNAVTESDTEELLSVSESTPRQNLVSPDLSEMTLASYTPATRTNESTDLLTADDGAPVSLLNAPVNSTVPEDVLATPAFVPSAVTASSRQPSDSNNPNNDQDLRPHHVQVASPRSSVSPSENLDTLPTVGLGHASKSIAPDDPRMSSLNNPTAPIHVDTLRESTLAIHISVPCARQHHLLDIGTSTTLLTDVLNFDMLEYAPLWYEIMHDMIIDVITASVFLPAEQFAILDDFRHSATSFGSSRLFDVRGKPLDTPTLLLQYLRNSYIHNRPNKYTVNIFINMSSTLIMETCTAPESLFRNIVADLRIDAALKVQAASLGTAGIPLVSSSSLSPATTVTFPYSHHSNAQSPSSTISTQSTDVEELDKDMSIFGLLASILGSISMVIWAFLWYFTRGGYLYFRASFYHVLVSIHQAMTRTIHRYNFPVTPPLSLPSTPTTRTIPCPQPAMPITSPSALPTSSLCNLATTDSTIPVSTSTMPVQSTSTTTPDISAPPTATTYTVLPVTTTSSIPPSNVHISSTAPVSATVQTALDSLPSTDTTHHVSPQCATFRGAPVMHNWDPNNPPDFNATINNPRTSFVSRNVRDSAFASHDDDEDDGAPRFTPRSSNNYHSYTPSFPTTYGTQRNTGRHTHAHGTPSVTERLPPTYTLLQGYAMDCHGYLRILSDAPNVRDFVRSSYVPVHHSLEPIGMWYRRFVAHGATNGIYIPPYESITPLHSLGTWFENMPTPIQQNVQVMSQYITNALNQLDVFASNSPERLIILNSPDGYTALYNLLRDSHPILKEVHQFNDCPRQFEPEPFLGYLTRFKSWALDELATGHHMSDLHLLGKVIGNVHRTHAQAINLHIGHQFRMLQDGDPIPHALQLEQLAGTMDNATRLYGTAPTPRPVNPYHRGNRSRTGTSRIHSLTDHIDLDHTPADDIDDFALLVQHITSQSATNGGCFCCESVDHNAADCPQLQSYVKMQLLFGDKPKLRSQIISKLRPHSDSSRSGHPPRTLAPPRGTTRSSTMHQVTQDDTPDDLADPATDTTDSALMHRVCIDNALDLDCDPMFDASLQCFSCSDVIFASPVVLGHEAVSPHLDSDLDDSLFLPGAPTATDNTVDVHALAGSSLVATLPQIDNGSQATTTAHHALLWCYQPYTGNYTLRDAGNHVHHPIGIGYLKIPTINGHHFVACFHTPSIPSTIISPGHLYRHQRCTGYLMDIDTEDPDHTRATLILKHRLRRDQDIHIPMSLSGGLTHSLPAIIPTQTEHLAKTLPVDILNICPHALPTSNLPATPRTFNVHILNREAQRVLWHNRLGHLHSRRVADLYKCTEGVPKIDLASDIDKCPTCMIAKARRTAQSTSDSRHATVCNQGISVDFGFIIQQSDNSKRYNRYQGLNGETCYILIADHFSGTLYGKAFRTKAPPVEWLNHWLALRAPQCPDKYVRFDQGGKLSRCTAVLDLFRNAGYRIEITGAGNSAQNGPVERPHQTIADGIRALLIGADLPPKFWPYAFRHFLRLYNMTPHAGRAITPFQICFDQVPDLSRLRTFGCRVYVRPPGTRSAKLAPHVDRGIFLGYEQTLKNIVYFDLASSTVKVNTHTQFDEGMNDVPTLPPNAEYLNRVQKNALPVEPTHIPSLDLDATTNPFSVLTDETIPITCNHPTFGFELFTCTHRRRVAISDILRDTTGAGIQNGRHRYIGAFLVAINGVPVFSLEDATTAFRGIRDAPDTPTLLVTLSPERQPPLRDLREPFVFGIDQLRAVNSIRTATHDSLDALSDDTLTLLVASLTTATPPTTPSQNVASDDTPERALGHLTRRKLLQLSTWPAWQEAIFEQLDNMAKQDMYGTAVTPPPDAIILRQHWTYIIKKDGRRKARQCCDGSKRAAPQLQNAERTFASCVAQPGFRAFTSLAASLDMRVWFLDATNAYANSPGPQTPTYVYIDANYAAWYAARHGVHLDRSLVLPVQHALQGHPEAGNLWESHINGILFSLGFTTTTHERSLYTATINGFQVLLCRQVDDLAIACTDEATAKWIITQIGAKVEVTDGGLLTTFNGVDIDQTRDYIKVSCASYISRLLKAHQWDHPSHSNKTDAKNLDPLPEALSRAIDIDTGPPSGTSDAAALEKQFGFSYRSVLGELLYAYVAGRLDIGYAMGSLARHSTCPAASHYTGLVRVAKYLRKTIHRGIIYWRPKPLSILPPGTDQPIDSVDDSLPSFPTDASPLELVGYVDAAYGTDTSTRRSVTGLAFTLGGGAIAYRSKLQPVVATSSTEAEFIAAVQAAKMAKYLRSVLTDLGFPQPSATPIYCDNEAAILMTNACKPTQRSRHIDIQWYAIQEWMRRGDIILKHLAGTINPADSLTKALGWILHLRHIRRLMGHHGKPG